MGTAEGAITQLFDGELMFTAREQISLGGRYFATSPSSNGGDIWLYKDRVAALPDGPRGSPFGNVGSLIRVPVDGVDILLYSNVDSDGGGMPNNLGGSNTAGREKLTVWASFDGGLTWPIKRLVYQGPAGASHLAVGREGTASAGKVFLLFEGGPGGWNSATHLATFNLTWLLAGTNPYDYLVWLDRIFWTGQNDRWGGGSETTQKYGWSAIDFQSPLFPLYALMDANGVSEGDAYHFVYDRQLMPGGNSTVRMNRDNVTMHSITLRGLGHSGFMFGNNDTTGQGIVLGANLTVQGGTHSFLPPPSTYSDRTISLAGDSHWDIDQNGSLYFLHSLSGPYSLYKSGDGMLRMTGVQQHTGSTSISDGVFGPGSGDLSLAGNLSIGPQAKLFFLPGSKIQVAGETSVSGEFGIQRLVNLLPETPPGIYTLIEGSVSIENLVNLGQAAAVPIAPGRIAYFENSPGLVLRVEMTASSQVLAAHVYHAGFSGVGLPPWNSIDTSKALALETAIPQTLTDVNVINTTRGINGLMLIMDRQGNQSTLGPNDFVFQMSPQGVFTTAQNPPPFWEPVPVIPSVDVNLSAPQEVLIQWPDQTLMNRWLRVTIKANSNTGLTQPQTYYIGHLLGETAGGANNGEFIVLVADILAVREALSSTATASSALDLDKSGTVLVSDILAVRSNLGQRLSQITIP
jgi:sialidase-1